MTKPEAAALQYPFEPPAPGHAVEVAPGVRWIRLSMPFRLDHINVWAIDTTMAGCWWTLV
nr:hypothetical protein [Paenacidovorax monticola]